MSDIPDLFSVTDFQRFKSLDLTWFLNAAADSIRQYCNWHVYPVVQQTISMSRFYPDGKVMLPSLKIVSLDAITKFDGTDADTSDFAVHEAGWLQYIKNYPFIGYRRGGSNNIRRSTVWPTAPQENYVSVTFTHGYEKIPPIVAEIGYEIVMKTLEKPAGVVRSMHTGPYEYDFNRFGMSLDYEQRARLTPYVLQGVV